MTATEPLPEIAIVLFQREIHRQAEFATIAIRDVESILNSPELDPVRFWYSMDAALGAVARLADILWPAQDRDSSRARAKALRDRFGIGDASYLADKNVRNALEHFAERMDDWAHTTEGNAFYDSYIGTPAEIGGFPESEIARTFDPDLRVVRVFDARLNLSDVFKELAVIEVLVPDPDEVVLGDVAVSPPLG